MQRLGTDRLDVVYVHDSDTHLDQALREALQALVASWHKGGIGAVGVQGLSGWSGRARVVRGADVDVGARR